MKLGYRFLYLIVASVLFLFIYFKFYKSSVKKNLNFKSSNFNLNDNFSKFSRKEKDCTIVFHKNNSQRYEFQKVDESVFPNLSHLYVYSAFYDTRTTGNVIVISVTEGYLTNLYCVIWFSENVSRIVIATITKIPEGNDRRYTASFINCPLQEAGTPLYVSILSKKCGPVLNIVPISIIPKIRISSEIAVCVTPFNLNYNKVDQFIETMSINRMLGASHTFFYNYSTGRNVEQLIDVYKASKSVTVLPFHLPMKVHIWPLPQGYTEEIKYFGQMAALNDCLYRTMGYYKYVAFSDMDEYLVPRKLTNWRQLINTTSRGTTAWLFRNTFFKIEWPSDEEMMKNKTIRELKAMTLLKVLRTQSIEVAYQRSKLIVDPLSVMVMGVHNVWKFAPNGLIHLFPVQDGLCHHYRFWDGLGEKTSVRDDNIFRLREDIVKAVQEDRNMLNHLL